ncbi:TPA: phosphoglucosamine mutase [Candidatus Poribacteria bacterium]|nr:phosphoglucosamine mutase [Candidatus Poribacteria bacterium]HIN29378.1 phosphoglucosamine mutase [Candidatus Poribacteria bacterium]
MENLIISASGVRGTIGGSFSPTEISRFATAFGTLIGGQTVVVGRDTRTSGEMVRGSLISGLVATGCDVIDVGVCPTPTILLTSKKIGAEGSVTITASHNPIDWNGLKLATKSGRLLSADAQRQFQEIYKSEKANLVSWDQLGSVETDDSAIDYHIAQILELDWINLDQIRHLSLKVAIDAGNGAGSIISPMLLRQLGCEVIEINCTPNGIFPRSSEPNQEALKELCQVTKSEGAHVGLAHDGDADRLVLVSDQGVPLSSEYTYALIADFLIGRRNGNLVATVSTSRMLDDVADKYGVELHRTPVGVGYVVEKMEQIGAALGGEGTGGVIYPEILHTADGITSIAAIVQLLASSNKNMMDLVSLIPRYWMDKKKIDMPSQDVSEAVLDSALTVFENDDLDTMDGVKRIWDDKWVNIRKSGTEPVIRVFSEARSIQEAKDLCNSTVETLKSLMKHVTDCN